MTILSALAQGCLTALALTISVASNGAQFNNLPNPADPAATPVPSRYESPFTGYKPFRDEEIRSWQEVNKEVADNPGMGSMGPMNHSSGTAMAGVDTKGGGDAKNKQEAPAHDMGTMKNLPGMSKPAASAPKSKRNVAGQDMGSMQKPESGKPGGAVSPSPQDAGNHDMGTMKGIPGMEKEAANAPATKHGQDMMAMAKSDEAHAQSAGAKSGPIAGSGVVQTIDKANRRVKLTHDPIAALGWPTMTMFFRLKESSLADQIKEGARVGFSLEKTSFGYVISSFEKAPHESSDHKPHKH